MAKAKSVEESVKRYVRNSLCAYLDRENNCTLNWIKRVIRNSGISADNLRGVFERSKDYGDQERYQKIFNRCQGADFNRKEIK